MVAKKKNKKRKREIPEDWDVEALRWLNREGY